MINFDFFPVANNQRNRKVGWTSFH